MEFIPGKTGNMRSMTENIETQLKVDADNCHQKASQLLATHSGLSQAKIKDAMQKGAVWLQRRVGKNISKQRLRRASKALRAGDILELNYNPQLLQQPVPKPQLIHDAKDYSIWFKPYGLHCQGSRWGDFASINRWVEVNLPQLTASNERPVFLVHRLDRATSGLILLCHSKQAARLFSAMFQEGKMDKCYQAIVEGDCSSLGQDYKVNQVVDGKTAQSIFSFAAKTANSSPVYSLVDIKLLTGRKHQIRQHLSHLGYPIVGDRLYGNAGKDDRDLQLQSISLAFECPVTGKPQYFSVDKTLRLKL